MSRYRILAIIGGLVVLGQVFNTASSSPKQTAVESAQTSIPTIVASPTLTPTPTPTLILDQTSTSIPEVESLQVNSPTNTPIPSQSSNNNLSNDNYYINSSGQEVHSPAYSESGGIPNGATAICGDGTYSFSQSRRGTCSHHGGVAQWL